MGLFEKLGFGLKKTKEGIFNSITKTIISSPLTDELYDELLEQLGKRFMFTEMERVSNTHRCVRFCTSWATRQENVELLPPPCSA